MNPAIHLMRPKQWIKSGFVVAPVFFSKQFGMIDAWQVVLLAALAFAAISSVVYIGNDIIDQREDRLHPKKSKRPIASGQIGVLEALLVAAVCALVSGIALTYLPRLCVAVVGAYVLINIAYTLKLKHIALLDVFVIAACFVMRVLMGCYALSVTVSPWIILTTLMLSLFLGFGKRYHELGIDGYRHAKKNLGEYNRELLDRLVTITAAATLVSYAIYTTEMAQASGNTSIVYTVVFVAFGLFRYLQSIYVRGQGGEPENMILKDRWQWINMALWLLCTVFALTH